MDDLCAQLRAIVEDKIREKNHEFYKSMSLYDKAEIERLNEIVIELRARLQMLLADHSELMIKYVELKNNGNANEPNR